MIKERKRRSISKDLKRESLPPSRYFLSTGSTLLDLAISDRYPGGVGSGRTTQLIGDNSTAKTVLMKEILGSAQRQGGFAVEEEAEYTPDFERAELFGLDVGDWRDGVFDSDLPLIDALDHADAYVYRNPSSLENVFDDEIAQIVNLSRGQWADVTLKKNNKGDTVRKVKMEEVDAIPKPIAIGIDTLTALPSIAELNRTLNEKSYNMERAKVMSAGFRKYIKPIGSEDITIVAVDHIRSNVGISFGKDWTVSGGKAMQQYASTRVFLKHTETLKNKHGVDYGVKIHFKVVKNKLAPPFREGDFYVIFDYGIDDIRSNIEWLRNQKVDSKLKVKGAWFNWGEERLGQGIEKAITNAEEMGETMVRAIEKEVVRVWRIIHEPTKRRRKR